MSFPPFRLSQKLLGSLFFFILSLVVLSTLIGSCRHREGIGPETLVIGLEGNPTDLDPRFATDAYSSRIIGTIFNGLLRLTPESELELDLARSYEEVSPTHYRFFLRPGVSFHHGRPVTADDVKFTYETIMDPGSASPRASSFEMVSEIKVVDPTTIEFFLSRPYAPFLVNLTTGIVPREVAERMGEDFSRHPVGTGPFRLVDWYQGEFLELRAFEAYFEGSPKLSRVLFKVIPNDTTRLLELQKGCVDLLQNSIPPYALKFLNRHPDIRVIQQAGINYSYVGFNLEDPILRDIRVRRAIAHAINRDEIISHILQGTVRKASGLLAPEHWANNSNVRTYSYDPVLSRTLLDEAGYPDPDGEGPKPRFFLSYKTSLNKTRKEIASVIQQQLENVGIKVEIRSLEWGTLFGDIKSGNFQIYTLTWVGLIEPDIYYYIFHSSSFPPGGANRGRYRDPMIDSLLLRGREETDQNERKKHYKEVQRILAEQVPYVSLWYHDDVVASRKGVKHFRIFPGGDFRSLVSVTKE